MVKSVVIRVLIVIIGIMLVPLGRGYFYYSGLYTPPAVRMPTYEHIATAVAPSTEFVDVYEKGKGVMLIDLAHDNAFTKDELNVLIIRLVSRGLTVDFLKKDDDLKKRLLVEEKKEKPPAEEKKEVEKEEEKIEVADAFIVISPKKEFTREERGTIEKFVKRGGKLLLIDDPTRRGATNSLSLQFGLIFESDYLYNMKESESNYRNIFITEFKEGRITKDLKKIALYTAGSISSAEGGIAFVDKNTFSSVIETRQRLSPIVQVQEGKIVAIHDLTFLTEPYNGILDNDRLIANIADWLASPVEKKEVKEETKESQKGE